jgi:hypothetical protein
MWLIAIFGFLKAKKGALFSSVEKRRAHGAFVVNMAIGVDCLQAGLCKRQASVARRREDRTSRLYSMN